MANVNSPLTTTRNKANDGSLQNKVLIIPFEIHIF